MVLLYRFHDMDSMRDPHIYCNQHSDQNKACAINMVAMPLTMTPHQQQLKIMRDNDFTLAVWAAPYNVPGVPVDRGGVYPFT